MENTHVMVFWDGWENTKKHDLGILHWRRLKKPCTEGFHLTRLTWLIHLSVLPSNWNLGKMFALTGSLDQVHMVKINISVFPPCRKMVIFITEIVKTSKYVIWITRKWLLHGGISKMIFLPYVLDLMDLLEQKKFLRFQLYVYCKYRLYRLGL